MDIQKLKEYMKKNSITYQQLADMTGLSVSTITKIFGGFAKYPRVDTMQAIEKALGVSEDVPDNLHPLDGNFHRLPVIGTIRAGYGGEAIEEYTGEFQDFPADHMKGYGTDELFVLEVRGDSMFPLYLDGDRVLIHKQTSVDSGTVAAVLYAGEDATLKKVTYEPNCDWVLLSPLNEAYAPLKIQGKDLQNCRVLGKDISLFRKL